MGELIRKLVVLLLPRERRHALVLLALMMGGALLEMAGVGAIPAFVTLLSDPTGLDRLPILAHTARRFGVDSPERLILVGAVALFVLFAVKNAYLAALSWVQARLLFTWTVNIAQRLLARYIYAPYTFHLQRNTGDLLRNVNQEAMEVVNSALMPLMILTMEGLTITGILLLLLWVEPATSLAALIILGGTTTLFLRVVRRRAFHHGQQMHEARGEMNRAIQEGLGGIKVTRVLGRESDFQDAFVTASNRFSASGRVRQVLADLPRLFLETSGIGGLLVVAAVLTWQGRPAAALISVLALLAVAVVRMIPSFNRITTALNSVRYGRSAVDAVYRDLLGESATGANDGLSLPFERSLCLDRVTYTYPGAVQPALRDVSLQIERGQVVGFVGQTGAGKTTLVDVVLGLLAPDEGCLSIDGVDVRGRERAWQRQLGYVPQDVYLTDASVRRNVAFGVPEADIDDMAVARALDAAQAAAFVAALPNGDATVVGERGVRLSGGQRQRLGIARALYHDPEVLVLDEATSALDSETEQAVMDAVEHLRGSRTILIIAHRTTTLRSCDVVYRLSSGVAGPDRPPILA